MNSFLHDRNRADAPNGSAPPAHPVGLTSGFTPLATLHAHTRAHSAAAAPGHPNPAAKGSPQIECIRQGDRVTRLIVTCSCGERIEIDCEYPPAG